MPVAVITGANRGIGFELTQQYVQDGWDVYALVRRSSQALDALAATGLLHVVVADLTNDLALDGAVADIGAPAVDLLLNCAGTMGEGSFEKQGLAFQSFGTFDRDEWRRVFEINVFTPQALTERLADKLQRAERGVVATLSSMLGSNGLNEAGSLYGYRASKAAVNSIMKSMGIDLGKRGIIAVALHPGWVRTDMGGAHADVSVQDSVSGLRQVIAGLSAADAGAFIAYDGSSMPW
ncbi:MAG: SDR family oxidoreductase [Pseudomonadota bacterium]